jgi:hypothetical protein
MDNVKYNPLPGVPVMTVDELELSDLDMIAFDIEGAELPALKGAEKTIERCRPGMILLEVREHTAVHGYTVDDLYEWLRQRGYVHWRKVAKDQAFVPR